MDSACQSALSKSEAAVTSAMVNVYFTAKQNLPNIIVPSLNEFCIKQAATHLNDLAIDKHTTYQHNTSNGDFQQSVADVLHAVLQVQNFILKTFSGYSQVAYEKKEKQ